MSVTLTDPELARLGDCVANIGAPEFPRVLSLLCAALCNADKVFLSALFDDGKPVGLYGNHTEEGHRDSLRLYLDVAYLLDPFYTLFRQNPGDQLATLDEVAPDDFKQSDYYAQFFKQMGLSDECGLLVFIAPGAALFFSMGTVTPGARVAPDRLRAALPLVTALARRHWAQLSPEKPQGTGRLSARLDAAFEAFGSALLSPREGEILRMILRGHSSKSIAAHFDNSPETIKVHRKRIYAKLGVASQGEVLSIFLQALSHMPAGAEGDPLQYLKAQADHTPKW